MEIIIALGIFFIFVTIAFMALAFFLPEWLGITGTKAKAIISSHSAAPSDGSIHSDDKSPDSDSKT